MQYEAVIGLEVHAQLLTQSKAFCACRTSSGEDPNTVGCPVCLGLPGSLPVLNREAVAMAVKTALALGCQIHRRSVFVRKNYFYPDMPKGYQISQYDLPLASHGLIEVPSGVGIPKDPGAGRCLKKIRIQRIHLEEDAGKSIHDCGQGSRIDFNRAGMPLLEIVSEPDFHNSEEALDYLVHLRKTLLFLGVCNGNMEKGSLRCDANISIRPREEKSLGTKVEIKNVNSFRFLRKALDYEICRQIGLKQCGGTVAPETRLWDQKAQNTFPMRQKEETHDYRYFPEPDLLPLEITEDWLEEIRYSLPELPQLRRGRWELDNSLTEEESRQLIAMPIVADFFDAVVAQGANPKMASHWIRGELTAEMKRNTRDWENFPVPPAHMAELLLLIEKGRLSGTLAKTVLAEMLSHGDRPQEVIERLGLIQISEETSLEEIIMQVLAENSESVRRYRAGKKGLFTYFMGQVMKKSHGQAHPEKLHKLLQQALSE